MSDQKGNKKVNKREAGEYSDEEAARRRDAILKRMLETPPQPKKSPTGKPKAKRNKAR